MSSRADRTDGGLSNGNDLQAPSRQGFRARLTDHVSVAVGTAEGLFLVSEGNTEGPYFSRREVSAFLQMGVRCYAASANAGSDPVIYLSEDRGVTWNLGEPVRVAFPDGSGRVITAVTQLQIDHSVIAGPEAQPVMLAGADPAALFRSVDGGATFEPLYDFCDGRHADAASEEMAVLHSILTHAARPDRILVGILGGGVFRSADGGRSWESLNDQLPAAGDYVNRIALDRHDPDVVWARTGAGTYRSDDVGTTWEPAKHSGPAAADPAVEGGLGWTELVESVPHAGAQFAVRTEAFAAGSASPFPLSFGTQAGEVFASLDGGITWRRIASHLPPVLCLRVLE
ncbi:MAG TPA: hypothetical protein VGP46_08115 [Acidimicrobiales bacterium]|jgi:hypothetical protein|nr:hypothetical protein [Acidimicrobiales bacterium]